jgi:hypothetical protein
MEKSVTASLSAEAATGSSEIVMRGNPFAFVATNLDIIHQVGSLMAMKEVKD